jgi:ribosome maturation factor RimP
MGVSPIFYLWRMNPQELIEKTVTGLGYELVDLEMSPRARVLRVFIDRPEKERGVDIDDCVAVSNQLSRVLTVENIDYDRLEVSSPGLDRPLKKPADYERFAGSEIHLKLRIPFNGRRNFNGVLQGLQDGKVCLQFETGEAELDLGNIERARLVPRFD